MAAFFYLNATYAELRRGKYPGTLVQFEIFLFGSNKIPRNSAYTGVNCICRKTRYFAKLSQ
jgi:hypothetical protein